MRALFLALFLWLGLGPLACQEKLEEMPPGVMLPIPVSLGLRVIRVDDIREAEGTFEATIDLRLSWTDPRLAFDSSREGLRRRLYGGRLAHKKMAEIWDPGIGFENLDDQQGQVVDEALWIDEDGMVEWVRRYRGQFQASFDVSNFPIDRQVLPFEFLSAEHDRHQVLLVEDAAALAFSSAAPVMFEGWNVGIAEVVSDLVTHWNGTTHSQIRYAITVQREPGDYIAPIFTPIAAVLLVPILAIWLNRWHDHRFAIESFEFMNIAVGGLFATIALTLAVYSSYPFLADGRNVVGRLFTLNYVLLAVAGVIILVLFRSQRGHHPPFSPGVALEIFRAACWIMPAVAVTAVAAIVITALP